MIIPRYANTGVLCASGTCLAPTEAERRKDCGSATHGTIRRHHSWGLLTPTSFYDIAAKNAIWIHNHRIPAYLTEREIWAGEKEHG